MLDPVRFSQTDELKSAEKERIKQVVIRRLKREINERTDPPAFCTRLAPEALVLEFSQAEQELNRAFGDLRAGVRQAISGSSKQRRLAGNFAIEILNKRLLSGPVTFLESWRRCKQGLAQETSDDHDVVVAGRSAEEETHDDREANQRSSVAAGVIGSWLKYLAGELKDEIAAVDKAAEGIGLSLEKEIIHQNPVADARFDALFKLIEGWLRQDGQWTNSERLVVFTEYKILKALSRGTSW